MCEHSCDPGAGSGGCSSHAPGRRAAFCYARALRQVDGDHDALTERAVIFQDWIPARLATLDAATAAGDPIRLRQVARDLRGMLVMIAARDAARVASELERDAGRRDMDAAFSSCLRLRREIERVLEALESHSWRRAA